VSCQHKRPGRAAKKERIRRKRERELKRYIRENTIVQFPCCKKQRDGYMGRVVAIGVPPEEGIA
jgi:hypothetical protein